MKKYRSVYRMFLLVALAACRIGSSAWASPNAGSLLMWGDNDYGYPAHGQANAPTGNDFVAIAGGEHHSLALKSDGSLAAWGINFYGATNVPAGNDFVAVAAGSYYGVALKSDGALVGWGWNGSGQTDVPAGNDYVAIVSGSLHNLALKSDGSLVTWGSSGFGQLDVPSGNDFVAIAAGQLHSLALRSDGSLAAWGSISEVPAGNDFVAIAAGGSHSLALKSDGSLVGWGETYFGQLNVPAGNDFVAIAAGHLHSLALKSDGTLVAWGNNDFGQTDAPAGKGFVAIAAGWEHGLAIQRVPEPSSIVLLASVLLLVVGYRGRDRWLRSQFALLLCAALVVISSAGGQRAVAGTVTVMAQNLYQGFDAEKFLADVSANPQNVVALTTAAYGQVLANDFAARADAVALAVDQHRPALIGLQEVSLYRSAPFDGPGPPHATNVEIDYLETLLDALSARGLNYAAVASVQNTDAEFPRLVGFDANNNPILQDIRLTDRDVILARTDLTPSQLEVSNPQSGNYSADFSASGITFRNGWSAVDVKSPGTEFRFVNTHLARSPAAIQELQAAELVAGLANTSLPTILVGDFNSRADGAGTASYANLIAAGFSDAWSAIHPDDPGYTCCQAANLLNAPSQLSERIDLALFRKGPVAMNALVVGAAQSDRTTTGLWQSDHAGIVATLNILPEPGTIVFLILALPAMFNTRRFIPRRSSLLQLAAICCFWGIAAAAQADIYQWEYINPANPSAGKRQSTTLTPDGAGANAVSGAMLFGRNLTKAYLIGAELGGYWVEGGEFNPGYYVYSNLAAANLTDADLTNANISLSDLYGTNFTNAEVRGAKFTGYSFTEAQLASTASYQAHDLTGISLSTNNLAGWNLAGQNLTNATFRNATLTGVNFANAVVRGAAFDRNDFQGGTGITAAQLATTASYQTHDLVGIKLNSNNLSGANFAGQNLSSADFYDANVNNANFSQANLSSASFVNAALTGANLNQANLAGAIFYGTTMTGATMAGADVRGALFSVITTAQLYSTASYQTHDLTGIGLSGINLAGVNLAGQNLTSAGLAGATLTNANFSQSNLTSAGLHQAKLTGANFTGATIRGADFTDYGSGGVSKSQLYSTASYAAHDLSGIALAGNDLKGVNFAGQNLTEANFSTATLNNGNLSQANLEGADFSFASVSNANLSQANLANANFYFAFLTGANLTGAEVRGANFYCDTDPSGDYGSGLTVAQLHSTASYAAHDLRGIKLAGNNLAGANLTGQDLTDAQFASSFDTDGADLTGAKFVQANLTHVNFYYATLHNANLSQANLTEANLRQADVSGANLTGADVRGADFSHDGNSERLSLAQLYSTASYQSHDLTGINLGGLGLAGANLAGQNLLNAIFVPGGADLAGANLSRANLTNVVFATSNLAGADLSQANLTGARLGYQEGHYGGANLTAANLSQANLTNANFAGLLVSDEWGGESVLPGADLTNANLSGADARGGDFQYAELTGANTSNLVQPSGHIAGLDLNAGRSLVVRDYDGNSTASSPIGPLPIVVEQSLSMDATGTMRLVFEADAWDSTISFAPGISVTRAGTLALDFAADVNVASQIGRTFRLFDWTGVSPTGAFNVVSALSWDLSKLYTTGEVRLATEPGPLYGDYNDDGQVDAADYTAWRDSVGSNSLVNRGAGITGPVGSADYQIWKTNFGQSLGAGSGATASIAIPEPSSGLLLLLGAAVVCNRRKLAATDAHDGESRR